MVNTQYTKTMTEKTVILQILRCNRRRRCSGDNVHSDLWMFNNKIVSPTRFPWPDPLGSPYTNQHSFTFSHLSRPAVEAHNKNVVCCCVLLRFIYNTVFVLCVITKDEIDILSILIFLVFNMTFDGWMIVLIYCVSYTVSQFHEGKIWYKFNGSAIRIFSNKWMLFI